MRRIAQQHSRGCGLACIASVLGVPYEAAARKLSKQALTSGILARDAVNILRRHGRRYAYRHRRGFHRSTISVGTIVFIRKSRTYPAGHYLLKTKSGWMDPWINFPTLAPVRSGYRRRLPGKAQYHIFPLAVDNV